ncbi:MAG: methyltransferase domain-containing protein [Planctomycetes bacterium]|nr:methyltransferase domain-containing protein [Planctomycetota bacterium]
MSDYPLGTDPLELERLGFQHQVWSPVTNAFFERLGVKPGMRVLDLGCGPGFVSLELAERVGPKGSVVALDEARHWTEWLREKAKERGFSNVTTVCARIQDADLPAASFDVVFSRWVFSFLSDPSAVATMLARCLKPGGALAIQDYNHEGVSIFPESEGFRAAVRATRALYKLHGGDQFVMGRISSIFATAGLELAELHPNVLAGGPESGAFRWADSFFPRFSAVYVEKGLMSAAERGQFLREWEERKQNPHALFYSPMVVDAVGRKRA